MPRFPNRGAAMLPALLVILAVPITAASNSTTDRQFTVERAVREALVHSPVLAAMRAEAEQAESRLVTARTYPMNPDLRFEGADRSGNGQSTTDWGVSLDQEIEIGGKRTRRVFEADRDLAAATSRYQRVERLLVARTRAAFVEALRSRELLEIERMNTDLARSAVQVATKRFKAGATAQIEVNLALVQVGRAERDLRIAEGAFEVAQTILAEVIGIEASEIGSLEGDLTTPPREYPPIAELLENATNHRADVGALRQELESAKARIEIERRRRIPNLNVGVFYRKEEVTDTIVGAGIGIRIPIFNRYKGEILEAEAGARRAESVRDALELRITREVMAALALYKAASESTLRLQEQVLGTLSENLDLLKRSYETGKANWTELLVFRREFVDAQREFVETQANARIASIELDLATARGPIQSSIQESVP